MDNKKTKKIEIIYEHKLNKLSDVLLKKAMGFKMKETSEDFELNDSVLTLVKKKVSVKYYPPDLSAIELLLAKQDNNSEIKNYTDEELEVEKQKLIQKLHLLDNLKNEIEPQNK